MTTMPSFTNQLTRACAAGIVLYASTSSMAHAIINMESIHLGVPAEGYSGAVNVGFSGASGNSERMAGSIASRFQHYSEGKTNILIFDYVYAESFSRKDQDKTFLHARRIRDISDEWAWELFSQAESNEFARIKLRGLAGGGLRASLIPRSKEQGLFIGFGGFYDHELISVEGNTTDSGTQDYYVANLYIVFKRAISNTAHFVSTTYLQPHIHDLNNYRAFEAAKLNIAIIDNLSLNLNLEVVHNNRPPQAVKQTDITYSTSIQFQF